MRVVAAATAALALWAAPAAAEPLAAHDTAAIHPPGRVSVGVFDPLRWGVADRLEIDTHPVLDLILAPNALLRWAAVRSRVSLTGEYGLSVPTMPMRWLQGYVFPSWDSGGGTIGWTVVPHVGFVLSTGERHVFSARADTAFGVPLEHTDAEAPHLFAPFELWLAPATRGLRSRAGVAYDHAITDGLRVRGAADAYLLGNRQNAPVSPLVFALSAGVDARLAPRVRLRLGLVLYDIDTHRTVVTKDAEGYAAREHVRNRDLFPTADVIVTLGR
jgi:hypothetical protein